MNIKSITDIDSLSPSDKLTYLTELIYNGDLNDTRILKIVSKYKNVLLEMRKVN